MVGVLVFLGILVSLFGGANTTSTPKDPTPAASSAPTAGGTPSAEPEKKAAVAVTAKKTEFVKSILAQDGEYTSVSVTVTNNSSKTIDVNPLYFTITDTKGGKHTAELGADKDQIATVELAPGENVTGTVTGKGAFTAKTVTYTDGLIGDSVRGDVS
ncbi:DUF4352 domain-containing protein [Streptomyces sp. NPDC058646]|uniref:DUF4352 domain-containing protein n=1 Tax=Streptomyces sp. NPDC058646 TaxID=3346574 RepID=UPI003661BA05